MVQTRIVIQTIQCSESESDDSDNEDDDSDDQYPFEDNFGWDDLRLTDAYDEEYDFDSSDPQDYDDDHSDTYDFDENIDIDIIL